MGLNTAINLKKSSVQLLPLIVINNFSRGSLQLHGTKFAASDRVERSI